MAAAVRLLTFDVGNGLFALEAAAVAEVVPAPPLTRVPQAPAVLRGLANVRGRVTPILALGALLDQASASGGGAQVVVLGDRGVGLLVDRVRAMGQAEVRGADGGIAELIETADGPARLLSVDALLASGVGRWMGRRAAARVAAAPVVAERDAEPLAYLEFHLGGQAYATPLEDVREVSPVPAALQALPGSDAAMLGVVALRNRLLPIVSTASVLGLPVQALSAASRIVIVTVGEAEAGLLVDGVCGVLRVSPERVGAAPAVLNRSAGEARIDSIVRAGERLVSVLPATRILDEATVAALLAEGAGQARAAAETDDEGAMQRFVLFRLGAETYGLPVADVDAVIRLPDAVSRVPGAPAFVAGVISHRGRALPLVDQAARFSSPSDEGGVRRVIVARVGDVTVGFIVDAVEQVAAIPDTQLQPAPDVAAGEDRVFDRVASLEHDSRLILLVDAKQLLDQTERTLVQALAERTVAGA